MQLFTIEHEAISHHSLFRMNRFESRLLKLLALIGVGTEPVGIEGYSFFSSDNSAATSLKELGGIIRFKLGEMGHPIMEIPPGVVKKVFSGNGQATKRQMLQAFTGSHYHLPNPYDLLNITDNGHIKDVAHPIEDLVDALGAALSLLVLMQ